MHKIHAFRMESSRLAPPRSEGTYNVASQCQLKYNTQLWGKTTMQKDHLGHEKKGNLSVTTVTHA